jgi:hypothetical protein
VGFAVAIIAAIVLTRPRPVPQAAPDSTPAAPNPADTLYLSARGAASYARQLAVAGGTPAQALHAGDSLQVEAESLATLGRKAEAAVLLTSAAALWQAATPHPTQAAPSKPAPVQAGPPTRAVTGPAASEKPAVTTSVPEPTPSDSTQIVRYYRELEEAIRTRQLSEVKRLLPNLGGSEEKDWRNLFNEKNLTALDAVYTVRSVTREGDGATALVKLELTLTKKDKFEHREREDRATLTNGPQGWRQVQAERTQ